MIQEINLSQSANIKFIKTTNKIFMSNLRNSIRKIFFGNKVLIKSWRS